MVASLHRAALLDRLDVPTVEGAWESCPGFADYINSGAPGDAFDGFALKYRVCEPISGSNVAIAVASDTSSCQYALQTAACCGECFMMIAALLLMNW